MLRLRLVPAAVLAFALALAQAGALTHLVGHAAAALHPQAAGPAQAEGDKGGGDPPGYCMECIALGGLDLPLANGTITSPSAAQGGVRPESAVVSAIAVARLPPRCRAPPVRA